jgi:hypothetical protein
VAAGTFNHSLQVGFHLFFDSRNNNFKLFQTIHLFWSESSNLGHVLQVEVLGNACWSPLLTRSPVCSWTWNSRAFVAACEHQPWKLCQGLPKSHLVARGPLINGNAPKFSSSKPKFSYSKISTEILSPPACRHPCETGRNFAHAIHLLGGQFWLRKVISKFYNFKHLHYL